ncbi:LLM class F420-dependent oxidoreductase [Mycobacterium intracellulare]|uniref:F420-dependent oxidoreductase n=1 Tax=Mycobacterium intracellulare subsp. chimaera TaxID=222805 RepID=A0A220Y7Z2_MYCIT|nr:LLM class F420-dependent oxidoreductase [Mycobacterium intracellulare]AOS90956.1 LLM class F420-dependent oxidoreductase [Mycobacterium intracellulare subsp. chimaera]ARV80918.1 LLM class F420-dependent oxidoreductase [Mycobacterium intracellulare subsp. chimaera]ASL07913.1 F420-dependent oxidoreductase [Mycobacterium intracellulare subsp. chimaera]ASL13567.1 F420-dependent oxidoreductase [Mycobacterium intracellulare subsp. chimaera]ASL19700.1 F420-dependent oxidoreductase [Mycobacterium i
MRIGLMVGSDKERARADRLAGLIDDGTGAESAGFAAFWIPQVPGYLDAMTAVTLIGQATDRIEIGTAVVPIQTRHPMIMAQQALTTQIACGGRFTLGIGPSHHWIVNGQLGLAYDRPARLMGDYLDVLNASFGGPGTVDVDNESYCVHSPVDVTDAYGVPILLSALGPAMLRLAGERAGGTILWMADERAIADHVVPRITSAATGAGRQAPRIVAGVPVALCSANEVGDARAYASEVLGHADFSPNYVRLLEHGDAEDVGDTMAAGDEQAILARLSRYRDAGVTDLAARIVPLGKDVGERADSRRRTQDFLSSLCPEL